MKVTVPLGLLLEVQPVFGFVIVLPFHFEVLLEGAHEHLIAVVVEVLLRNMVVGVYTTQKLQGAKVGD